MKTLSFLTNRMAALQVLLAFLLATSCWAADYETCSEMAPLNPVVPIGEIPLDHALLTTGSSFSEGTNSWHTITIPENGDYEWSISFTSGKILYYLFGPFGSTTAATDDCASPLSMNSSPVSISGDSMPQVVSIGSAVAGQVYVLRLNRFGYAGVGTVTYSSDYQALTEMPSSMPSSIPSSMPSSMPTTKSGKTPTMVSTKAPSTKAPTTKSTKAPINI